MTARGIHTSQRFALVTGGGAGIGRAFCSQLVSEGWTVAVADCNVDAARATVAECVSACGHCEAFELEVSDPNSWTNLLQVLQEKWPGLDLLVNNAGMLVSGAIASTAPADLQRIVAVNLLGPALGCSTMTPWLVESRRRSNASAAGVINVASVFAALSPPGFAAYSATKAGVVALSEALSGELRAQGLTVTVAAPGVTRTSLFANACYTHENTRAMVERYLARAELEPGDVARETLAAWRRGKLYVTPGRRARLYWRLKRLAPAWLIGRVASKAQAAMANAEFDPPSVPEITHAASKNRNPKPVA